MAQSETNSNAGLKVGTFLFQRQFVHASDWFSGSGYKTVGGTRGTMSLRTDIKFSRLTPFFFPFYFPRSFTLIFSHLTKTVQPHIGSPKLAHNILVLISHHTGTTQHHGIPVQSPRYLLPPHRPLSLLPSLPVLPPQHHHISPASAATPHSSLPKTSSVGVVRTFLESRRDGHPHQLHASRPPPHRASARFGA